jgi:hypothetical protein
VKEGDELGIRDRNGEERWWVEGGGETRGKGGENGEGARGDRERSKMGRMRYYVKVRAREKAEGE